MFNILPQTAKPDKEGREKKEKPAHHRRFQK